VRAKPNNNVCAGYASNNVSAATPLITLDAGYAINYVRCGYALIRLKTGLRLIIITQREHALRAFSSLFIYLCFTRKAPLEAPASVKQNNNTPFTHRFHTVYTQNTALTPLFVRTCAQTQRRSRLM